MKRGLLVGMGLVLVGGVVTPAVTPIGADTAVAVSGAAIPCDFDGDGYADLAVGVPFEDLRGVKNAGAVQVMYGSASGVTARDQLWHQGRRGVKGALEKGDQFGDALVCGDFDADGYADLAIGIPYEDIGSRRNAGVVQVLYGGSRGLTARDQIWHQGKPGVLGRNEGGDRFGYSVAAGDVDADGYADLVVGVAEAVGDVIVAGRVVLLRGGAGGLSSSGAQTWRQGLAGIAGQPAVAEMFGDDLAVGDVNGDGHDDVAIVVAAESDIPPDDILAVNPPSADSNWHGSAVHLLFGGPTGLTSAGSQYILTTDLLSGQEIYARFTATFGDFNRDGRADLVLASADSPEVVLHGHADGVHVAPLPRDPSPGQDGLLWCGGGEEETAINAAAGDITGDGYPDLMCEGGPGIVLGTAAGLSSSPTSFRYPRAEYADLQVLPLSGGSHAWLVATHSHAPDSAYTGAVTVLQGTADGNPGPVTMWSQDSPGIKGAAEPHDGFGVIIAGP